MSSKAKIITLVLVLNLLQACASAARPDRMVPENISPVTTAQPVMMTVESVGGGSATNPMFSSQVGDEEFRQALTETLSAAGLSNPGASAQNTYAVDASLTGLSDPSIGLNFRVESEVYYRVTRTSDSRDIFAESINASGTGQISDSLIAIERLRIAKEYSIRENISAFIERIVSTLNSSQ
jgi:hypothetical protein